MNWQSTAIREASRIGDYGKVIELARRGRMTQRQLGEAIGLSQSGVSRLEKRGTGAYSTDILAAASAHLGIPPTLVGLADNRPQGKDGDVDRRRFLGGAAAAVAAPILTSLPETPPEGSVGQTAALRLSTTALRRLDGSTSSRDLRDPVHTHIGLIQSITNGVQGDTDRARLAAVGSEAASLAGWLHWDMGDYGSARMWYGSAIKAARVAGDPLLTAYQIGSLAQFEAYAGNATHALNATARARSVLGSLRPQVADAWLGSVEALAHAAAGDQRAADRFLCASLASAETLPDDLPPWPWVFPFGPMKVAACRVTCGARLRRPDWVLSADVEALATGHTKQRALLILDIAAGHLAAGRVEAAFALAAHALDTGLHYRSGRIVERAREVRRAFRGTTPPKVVREFDERLHDVYL
ncbi:helix-turn-helix domain-containing protein [Streptomyces sudanensis]|uniref:helix-turn-helix domain-containing protein n=1 Tax=Streptomyces sudanensis TaxID=436397 RepID=UPI0020CCF50C|nr:helix-turn-helix transcriptional regulator [Streptomyces sudanensis]MCP9957429.1 helix-turn-helix domain-containing protein [Streptomyces sudanensis]MCP9986572.1 helix-turn-helix domain-containing protein [Streptomyces sudanensis]MCQ0002023.1 helix-turn-helix domain-containing protein [Streptomyces sudanensis]